MIQSILIMCFKKYAKLPQTNETNMSWVAGLGALLLAGSCHCLANAPQLNKSAQNRNVPA
ncbi:LPXTG cell wall anchor domain-containing protein [Lactiplantibacillus xiangfangensis]|uniref:LPXTG cell wall anchor domain-containing protein n=1 Tax=Lactiplantibacillus xiangfangensis TaxID=942150 RepID=UPI0009F98F45